MTLSAQEVSGIIDHISRLTHPCIFEAALSLPTDLARGSGIKPIEELRELGILTFLDCERHALLIGIKGCRVCGWALPRHIGSHEDWYRHHTTCYSHIYTPHPY